MLEKILEEIEAHAIEFETFGVPDDYISVGWVKDIIRKHINNENPVGGVDRSGQIDESRTRGWIPVEEYVPEDGNSVLCTDGKYIYLTEYDADLDASFGDIDGIIAWQPLPGSYISKKETETDWSKVPVDTPVLVRDSDEEPWKRRHFAFYKDGKVFTWLNRSTSFVNGNDKDKSINWGYAKLATEGDK